MRWERTLIGECRPFSVLVRPPPFPLLRRHALGGHAALGVPCLPLWVSIPPSSPACCVLVVHAARGVPLPRHQPLRVPPPPPPFLACRALGAHAAQGVPPPRPPGLRAPPPPLLACRALGAHAAVWGDPPLPPSSGCVRCMRGAWPPPPPASVWVERSAGAGDPLPRPGPHRTVGSRAVMFGGFPPVPRCTTWAQAAGWWVPPPFPPP